MTRSPRALSGLRVIDCASLAHGPTVGSLLADLGAEVIRIEPPAGDPARTLVDWQAAARGCRSLTLALSDPRGGEILLRLVEDADVFVERFPSGTLEGWGLGADELRAVNQGLEIVRGTTPAAEQLRTLLGVDASSSTRVAEGWPGPALGRHTEEIFAELGLTRGELEDLRADGVV